MVQAAIVEDKRLPALFICQRLRIKQREIAALAGTDQATVSRTLNGVDRNEKVLAALRQLVSAGVATDRELFGDAS